MAKLIIKRTSEWNNRMRDIEIYLEEEKIGVIANGEVKAFEIESGEHNLKSKIDWCGSEILTFNLNPNETKTIELSGFKLGKFMLPIGLIIGGIYFIFGKQLMDSPMALIVAFFPIGLFLVYYLTLGRNKYLRLKEI